MKKNKTMRAECAVAYNDTMGGVDRLISTLLLTRRQEKTER